MRGDYVSTEDVIAGLEKVRKSLCAYGVVEGRTCDCKYLRDGGVRRAGSEQTGCCEIRQAMDHLRTMSKGVQPWPKSRVEGMLNYAKGILEEIASEVEEMP